MVNKKSQKAKKIKQTQKKCVFNAPTICLSILSLIFLCTTIFFATKSQDSLNAKKAEAFESLATIFVQQATFIEGEQATGGVDEIGISEDGDLYITFKITKYENHVGVAEQDFKYFFICEKDKPLCGLLGSAGDWIDIPEEEQAEARRQIEEMEKLEHESQQ